MGNQLTLGGSINGATVKSSDNLTSILSKASGGAKLSVEKAWREVSALRRAVKIRAQATAGIPWSIYEGDSDDPVFGHDWGAPPDDLIFARDLTRLLFLIDASVTLEGKAFMKRQYPGMRRSLLQDLLWLNPTKVDIKYSRTTGQIEGYERKVNGVPESVSLEDMVTVYAPDVYSEIGPGTADAVSARVHADILHSLSTFTDGYLDSGLLKATIVSVSRGTQKEQRDALEKWWNENFAGKNRAGKTKVLESDTVDINTIGEGLKDIGHHDLTDDEWNGISAATGVPKAILLSSSTTFNHAEKDDVHLYDKTSIPAHKIYAASLNRQVFNPLGFRLEAHYSMIPAISNALLNKANSLYRMTGQKAVLSVDEGREMFLGLGPMEIEEETTGPEEGPSEGEMIALEETENMDKQAWKELYAWRSKVRHKGASAPFEIEHLPPELFRKIRSRLDRGETWRTAFRFGSDF